MDGITNYEPQFNWTPSCPRHWNRQFRKGVPVYSDLWYVACASIYFERKWSNRRYLPVLWQYIWGHDGKWNKPWDLEENPAYVAVQFSKKIHRFFPSDLWVCVWADRLFSSDKSQGESANFFPLDYFKARLILVVVSNGISFLQKKKFLVKEVANI